MEIRQRKINSTVYSSCIETGYPEIVARIIAGRQEVFDKNNFAGIQGVVASKISEKFGIPTIMLADIDNSLVSGSGRAGQFLHLQDALQTFDEIYPDILISYGGHKAAAGVKLHKNNIKTFQNGFYNIVKEQLQGQDITPYIKTDGSLKGQISFGTYNQIEQLSPFSRAIA